MAKVKGLKDAERALAALKRTMEAEAKRKHVRKGAKVLSDEAKMNAASIGKSGKLAESIGILDNPDDPAGVYVTARRSGRFKKGYVAHLVEYGTAPHKIKPKTEGGKLKLRGGELVDEVDHPGAKAQPFMRPAWDVKKDEARKAIAASIKKELEKAK